MLTTNVSYGAVLRTCFTKNEISVIEPEDSPAALSSALVKRYCALNELKLPMKGEQYTAVPNVPPVLLDVSLLTATLTRLLFVTHVSTVPQKTRFSANT